MLYFASRCLPGLLLISKLSKPKIKRFSHSNDSYIIKSHLPNVEIPHATVPQYVFENFNKFPYKTAAECATSGRKYTFEQLRNKAINLGNNLRLKLKLSKGDVVAVFMPNIPEFPISFLGILQGSMVVTTINSLHKVDEIKKQLKDSDAKVIITTCSLHTLVCTAVSPTDKIHIVTIKTKKENVTPVGSISFDELVDTKTDIRFDHESNPNDVAVIPYSSGTTGFPKGVLHTHLSLVANQCQLNAPEIKIHHTATENYQDVIPAIVQLSHMYGLVVLLLNGLSNLSKIVTLTKFKPNDFINTLENHKPTILYTAPPIIIFMANHTSINKSHFECLRIIISTTAPLRSSDEAFFLQKAQKYVEFCQGYGTTETGLILFNKQTNKPSQSVGFAVPNVTLKVVSIDDPHQTLPCYSNGQLLVKGPQNMIKYHNRPEDSENALINGFVPTGDVVYYDNDKNIYVVDRLKELIKVKGYQVAPAELEEIILSYPNVKEVAVIGIPHNLYGEVPRAYITILSQCTVNTKDIEKYVADKVSSYKNLVGGIVVVDKLPKNDLGKCLRKELKIQYSKEIQIN
ncbi:hypothetical protein FQA39_LY01947 [Lamprigera yunnana]|nr:hypothetical protein FQA39_LY01947 [Lamprigera yunnana]